jgi:hypothetical protein
VGSVKDALFPGWATLLASFLATNNEDVSRHHVIPGFSIDGVHSGLELSLSLKISGCKLTVGARALAKHVHRSASGWWGRFSGSGMVISFHCDVQVYLI